MESYEILSIVAAVLTGIFFFSILGFSIWVLWGHRVSAKPQRPKTTEEHLQDLKEMVLLSWFIK